MRLRGGTRSPPALTCAWCDASALRPRQDLPAGHASSPPSSSCSLGPPVPCADPSVVSPFQCLSLDPPTPRVCGPARPEHLSHKKEGEGSLPPGGRHPQPGPLPPACAPPPAMRLSTTPVPHALPRGRGAGLGVPAATPGWKEGGRSPRPGAATEQQNEWDSSKDREGYCPGPLVLKSEPHCCVGARVAFHRPLPAHDWGQRGR